MHNPLTTWTDRPWWPRWILAFVLLVWFSVLPGFAASKSQLQFDVFLGYDNVTPEGRWFPIICEVDWDGDPFKASIEVSGGAFGGEQTYREEVEITGVRKRILIPVFSSGRYSSSWRVRLMDAEGKKNLVDEVDKRPRIQYSYDTPLYAAIPRTAGGLPNFPQMRHPRPESRPDVARILPDLFPFNPIALDGLDVFYLNSERAIILKAPQVDALLSWVRGGGHLIVTVEQSSDIDANPWLKAIAPLDYDNSVSLKAGNSVVEWMNTPTESRSSAFNRQPNMGNPFSPQKSAELRVADFVVATGKMRDGKTVASVDETPLIVTANRGRGKITMINFSPEREPMASWEEKTKFWARVMEVPTRFFNNTEPIYPASWGIDTVFGAMIESKQVHKPPVHWLLLLLGLYLVVIGPLDQYWLKKINRQMLTWITFPCYVVLFSGLIYFIGFMLRSGEREWNELHMVDVMAKGAQSEMHGRSYTSIYSPITSRYPISNEADFSMLRGEYMGIRGQVGGAVNRTRVTQKGNRFEAELNVPVWISQVYANDWWHTTEPPLTVNMNGSTVRSEFIIQNNLSTKVGPVCIAYNDQLYKLGELAPGEKKTFTLSDLKPEFLSGLVATYTSQFQSVAQERQSAFGNNAVSRTMDPAMGSMASSFMSQSQNQPYSQFVYPKGFELTPLLNRGDAVVLVWAPSYSPIKPINRFDAKKSNRNTLLRIAVTPKKSS